MSNEELERAIDEILNGNAVLKNDPIARNELTKQLTDLVMRYTLETATITLNAVNRLLGASMPKA